MKSSAPADRAADDLVAAVPAGQEDEVDVPVRLLLADLPAKLDAGQPRHLPVGDDEPRRAGGDPPGGGLAVRDGLDLVARFPQRVRQELLGDLVVVRDQDLHRSGLSRPVGRVGPRCRLSRLLGRRGLDVGFAVRTVRHAMPFATQCGPHSGPYG